MHVQEWRQRQRWRGPLNLFEMNSLYRRRGCSANRVLAFVMYTRFIGTGCAFLAISLILALAPVIAIN